AGHKLVPQPKLKELYMGNSVQDWQPESGNNQYGYRDRYRNRLSDSDRYTRYTTGQVPSKDLLSAGSQSRIRDINQQYFHQLMALRDKHPMYRNIDWGHSMALERAEISSPSRLDVIQPIVPGTDYYFKGFAPPTVTYGNMMRNLSLGRPLVIPSNLGLDRLALYGYGSSAIAKSIPDIPDFSLPRFIGELREGLPKVPLTILGSERKVRSAGGEYLNLQFGLMPTVSDLQKLFQLLMSPRANDFIRHNLDEEFRVRKVLDKGESTVNTNLTGTSEMYTLYQYLSRNDKVTSTRTQSYRIWSSCTFKYYQVHQLQNLISDLEKQLGMGVIPTAIDFWNLIPWSWFVDWFTNFNDVVTNLSYLGRSGLHLQRGYIMGTFKDEEVLRHTGTINGVPYDTVGTISYERKYRVRASPFGFGLTWKEFNAFQTSILGALTISRLRF
ncbi:maturation protein, partial [ssRNA phage Gerhypos.1_25]